MNVSDCAQLLGEIKRSPYSASLEKVSAPFTLFKWWFVGSEKKTTY